MNCRWQPMLRSPHCLTPFPSVARSQFPTYAQYVTNPIDLGTIRKRIASLMHYSTVNELLDDVKLLAENAQR